MKFRKTCDYCNVTFFTPNRNALYCVKCAKKMGVEETATTSPSTGRPARATATASARGRSQADPVAVAKPRGPVLVKKAKKGPRPPKPSELTDEIKEKIIAAFREADADAFDTVRALHASIAEKLWVRRWMVADVVQEMNARESRLTAEQRDEAAEAYRQMVENHERPAGGRRKSIATEMDAPLKEVILAVRDWARRQEADSPNPKLSRQQLFEIEKAYWRELDEQRYTLDELPQRLAEDLGFANRWQVLRWVDVLHDDPRAFENVPEPDAETRDAIVEKYQEYLAADEPPDKGLHQTIAETVGNGLKPRQVHKVLQAYRHERRAVYSPA